MWLVFFLIDALLVIGLIRHALSPTPRHSAKKPMPHWIFMVWLLAVGIVSGVAVIAYAAGW